MNKPTYFRVALAVAGLAFLSIRGVAQVPQLINYQGRVAVGDVNFNGTGQFKLALIDGFGTTTYWSNDGSSVGAGEPTAFVSLAVANGLYSVLLGNTALPGMTGIPPAVFNNADVRLRVWFDDGVHGFQMLAPDERIAAVGYAMKAAFASTVSDGAITAEKIAGGAAMTNLNASGQGAVPSGGLILSLTENPALVSAGYIKVGTATVGGFTSYNWQAAPAPTGGGVPSPRVAHTLVWTGSEAIIWGGSTDGLFTGAVNTGGRYNPMNNTWAPVATGGAPAARTLHTAVWTGTEMLIWGGGSASGAYNDGARYNPGTDTWTPISTVGAPAARHKHTAVWTGSKMIVWSGESGTGPLNDGAKYDPASDTWTPMTNADAPAGRVRHTAVWTDTEMIVWGGENATGVLDNGARYSPGADLWTPINQANAPAARIWHTAVWTGSRMIVWGGLGNGFRNDGGRYNPADNTWQAMSTASAPGGRVKHSAVWTGTEMIIWGGGSTSLGFLANGGRYNPTANTWLAIPSGTGPVGREDHAAAWIGNRMILWGGWYSTGVDVFLNDTWFLDPVPQTMHLYQRP